MHHGRDAASTSIPCQWPAALPPVRLRGPLNGGQARRSKVPHKNGKKPRCPDVICRAIFVVARELALLGPMRQATTKDACGEGLLPSRHRSATLRAHHVLHASLAPSAIPSVDIPEVEVSMLTLFDTSMWGCCVFDLMNEFCTPMSCHRRGSGKRVLRNTQQPEAWDLTRLFWSFLVGSWPCMDVLLAGDEKCHGFSDAPCQGTIHEHGPPWRSLNIRG